VTFFLGTLLYLGLNLSKDTTSNHDDFRNLAICCLGLVFLSDAIFSFVLIYLFVQPLHETIGMAKGMSRGKSIIHLNRISKNALVGGVLAVISSSLFYLMVGASVIWIEEFYTKSIWLNWQITGVHLDSICNDLGVLISSGVASFVVDSIQKKIQRKVQSEVPVQGQTSYCASTAQKKHASDWVYVSECEDDPEKKARKSICRTGAADRTASSGEPQRPKHALKSDARRTSKVLPLAVPVAAEKLARKCSQCGTQGNFRPSAGLSSDKDWEGEPRRPEPLCVGQTNISDASGMTSTAAWEGSVVVPKVSAATCISAASSNAGWKGETKRPEPWKGEAMRPEPWKGEATRPGPRKGVATKPGLVTPESRLKQAEMRYQKKVGKIGKDGGKRKFVTMVSL
jgi:hypothetical protein